jgi:hypothetical protein
MTGCMWILCWVWQLEMIRKDLCEPYEKALALPQNVDGSKRAALDRAHEMRKFEIDNYWKRATYFWSFQLIAFTVLGLMFKDGKLPSQVQILQIPAAIGALSGFVGYLSAKGSKYWQENWEAHVDMLEDSVEGRLTQTIWSQGKRSHSVTRINQSFMLIITTSWVAVMAATSFSKPEKLVVPAWLCFFSLLGVMGWMCWTTRQNFSGQVYRKSTCLEEKPNGIWSWNPLGRTDDQRKIILRDTKAKKANPPQ